MIDYFFKFATRADVAADPFFSEHFDDSVGRVRRDYVVVDPTVWRHSQTTFATTTNAMGQTYQKPTITPIAGFHLVIVRPGIVAAFRDHPNIVFALDEDQTPPTLRSIYSVAIMNDIRFAPVIAGRNYTFGALA